MRTLSRRRLAVVLGVTLAAALLGATGAHAEDEEGGIHHPEDATGDKVMAADQFQTMRAAPGDTVNEAALFAGQAAGQKLPSLRGVWNELTDMPYQSDSPDYRDPNWSNSGAGSGFVGGRIAAIATDGNYVYAGAADGGVWRSRDRGENWTPVFDKQSTLAVGAVAVNPVDHSVWVGTGEANNNGDSYGGDGIYRSADYGRTWERVGASYFGLRTSRIVFDGAGHVYAGTSFGLLRHDLSGYGDPWTTALAPATGDRANFVTDVRVRPGTSGRTIAATIAKQGLRAGAQNGFYLSTDSGATFAQQTATGDLTNAGIGRTTFSWDAKGVSLYAVVQNGAPTGKLTGVFRADSGNAAGPWTKVADTASLTAAGAQGCGGCQGWYDQYVTVDPADVNHLYMGLEDIYESSDRGATWQVIGPYWNFGLPCWNADPKLNTCPGTTHADQHAAVVSADGTAYFGNDGGVYSRPASLRGVVKWDNRNKTLHALQYYSVGVGKVAGGDAVWGGLQDNGNSLLLPGAAQQVSPSGGDGGQVIVDPKNGDRAVNEYVNLTTYYTTTGGRSTGGEAFRTMSPSCGNPMGDLPALCDDNTLFIAPFSVDPGNVEHWVAGGRYIWDNAKGFAGTCGAAACDWTMVHDTGAQTTAVATVGGVTYAGWQLRGTPYKSGIDTNAGGTWHRLAAPNLPNRYITSFLIDPANPANVTVTYGGYTDAFTPGGGKGHVFTSADSGATWTDVTGNLPDLPTISVVHWQSKLIAATDAGVYASLDGAPGAWYQLGILLPNAASMQLTVAPDGDYLLLATHGRGIWTLGRHHGRNHDDLSDD
ncbi:hypothetical protein R8Z50_21760 [Longispora sp. K20-0274]|uniref:hypothetical protein n=1 Tax=Longispora sp. K20-0274 TaxID=3088255 RepID=UPI00399B4925